eukprot:14429029-Alexandrium_andersonii.AAC.1
MLAAVRSALQRFAAWAPRWGYRPPGPPQKAPLARAGGAFGGVQGGGGPSGEAAQQTAANCCKLLQ